LFLTTVKCRTVNFTEKNQFSLHRSRINKQQLSDVELAVLQKLWMLVALAFQNPEPETDK